MSKLLEEGLSNSVLAAAFEVHSALGPGLLESAYESCLAFELQSRQIAFRRQVELPVLYKGHSVECGFRVDFIVGDRIVLELKAVDGIHPVREAQLLTYLRLTGLRIGYILNFNVKSLRDGYLRRVL